VFVVAKILRVLFHAMGRFRGDASDQAKQSVENGERMRRAAGDVEIHREDRVRAVVHFGMVDERSAGDCAGTDRNDEFWIRDLPPQGCPPLYL